MLLEDNNIKYPKLSYYASYSSEFTTVWEVIDGAVDPAMG